MSDIMGPSMTPEQREAVLRQFRAKLALSRGRPSGPGPASDGRPLRDVTLKGEALRQARKAAGINIPVPAEATP
jgi:hypothetical protein